MFQSCARYYIPIHMCAGSDDGGAPRFFCTQASSWGTKGIKNTFPPLFRHASEQLRRISRPPDLYTFYCKPRRIPPEIFLPVGFLPKICLFSKICISFGLRARRLLTPGSGCWMVQLHRKKYAVMPEHFFSTRNHVFFKNE